MRREIMALFLDSADVKEAERAMQMGFVAGITTNPTLVAPTGRQAYDVISELCSICRGPVFHQLTASSLPEMQEEAERFHAIAPGRVVMKIPCNLVGLQLTSQLSDAIPCALTAVFSAAQTYLACEADARYAIPYVNRTTRLCGDGIALVCQMAGIVERAGSGTEIVAASLKTSAEVVEAILNGAHHVTLPLQLIEEMAGHQLSELAIEEFARAAAG
jgi:transaldolase